MSGICDDLRDDLSLYAEGELDGPRRTVIRLHLEACAACRSWVEDYDAFTRAVLEEEPAGAVEDDPAGGDVSPGSGGAPIYTIHGSAETPWGARSLEGRAFTD